MQALRRIAQLVLPVAIGLPGLAGHVSAADVSVPGQADVTSAAPVAAATPAAGLPSATATATQSATRSERSDSFGVAMTPDQLDQHRGGEQTFNNMTLTGAVTDNTANKVITGSNSINQGSFANASGLPTVIQNTGANVLIQNATILNVRFGN